MSKNKRAVGTYVAIYFVRHLTGAYTVGWEKDGIIWGWRSHNNFFIASTSGADK